MGDVIVGGIVQAALSILFSAVPFLGWPIISGIVSSLVMKMFSGLSKVIDFTDIHFKVAADKEKYDASVAELKVVHDNPGSTPDEIEAARLKFEADAAALISFRK